MTTSGGTGRTVAKYYQRRKMLLVIDFRDSVINLADILTMVWEAPFAGEKIESAEKRRILDRVYDYLVRQRGFKNVEYQGSEER